MLQIIRKTHFIQHVGNISVNGLIVPDKDLKTRYDAVVHAIVAERITAVCIVFTEALPVDQTESMLEDATRIREQFKDIELIIMGQEQFRKIR